MRNVLREKFFNRETPLVARELLGKFLVRDSASSPRDGSAHSESLPTGRASSRQAGSPRAEIAGMITEVEAYDGFKDKASHASRGMTARNAPMFGPAGNWYVYLTYGMHWMLNVVTREKGYPAAILIRGVVVAPSLRSASGRRSNLTLLKREIASASGLAMTTVNGPARLTKYFHIDKALNAKPATRKTGLWIEDRGARILPSKIKKSPRIGVDYAGSAWAGKRWRFSVGN